MGEDKDAQRRERGTAKSELSEPYSSLSKRALQLALQAGP